MLFRVDSAKRGFSKPAKGKGSLRSSVSMLDILILPCLHTISDQNKTSDITFDIICGSQEKEPSKFKGLSEWASKYFGIDLSLRLLSQISRFWKLSLVVRQDDIGVISNFLHDNDEQTDTPSFQSSRILRPHSHIALKKFESRNTVRLVLESCQLLLLDFEKAKNPLSEDVWISKESKHVKTRQIWKSRW